jgi:hypothetical protein
MTNREMFLLATSILFASTTAGLALQGTLAKPHHGPKFGHERHFGDHDKRGPRPDFFAKADTNADGFVTREEMAARQEAKLDEMFETVDTNKDGQLSREEMEKGRDLMRAKMKARYEAERKGAPAPAEAPAQ